MLKNSFPSRSNKRRMAKRVPTFFVARSKRSSHLSGHKPSPIAWPSWSPLRMNTKRSRGGSPSSRKDPLSFSLINKEAHTTIPPSKRSRECTRQSAGRRLHILHLIATSFHVIVKFQKIDSFMAGRARLTARHHVFDSRSRMANTAANIACCASSCARRRRHAAHG